MNYKLLKIGYVSLGIIILISCVLGFIFIDEVLQKVSVNTLIIISACLCFPMFVLKILHEQKYPPTKKDKIIGAIIAMATLILIFII
ncbi:hypothetical protein H2O64_18860 [Kordia sp. YSTF-M3]|uniref:Uncharacterized protein n=1 Tax=Kordia aestuariivivens TaxID=2759037 RepID=A0ABR7QDW8_9FLAO|nr:hypothetical protein [Kordia aestuariivivens]MBC8756742.1 hypothetical protein [Kordia aestuariivivens]